jgi:hypothetical protein
VNSPSYDAEDCIAPSHRRSQGSACRPAPLLELPSPVANLALGFVFRNTVALLDQADQLFLVALDPGDVVVRQITPGSRTLPLN